MVPPSNAPKIPKGLLFLNLKPALPPSNPASGARKIPNIQPSSEKARLILPPSPPASLADSNGMKIKALPSGTSNPAANTPSPAQSRFCLGWGLKPSSEPGVAEFCPVISCLQYRQRSESALIMRPQCGQGISSASISGYYIPSYRWFP